MAVGGEVEIFDADFEVQDLKSGEGSEDKSYDDQESEDAQDSDMSDYANDSEIKEKAYKKKSSNPKNINTKKSSAPKKKKELEYIKPVVRIIQKSSFNVDTPTLIPPKINPVSSAFAKMQQADEKKSGEGKKNGGGSMKWAEGIKVKIASRKSKEEVVEE